jgi:hypothetical protein
MDEQWFGLCDMGIEFLTQANASHLVYAETRSILPYLLTYNLAGFRTFSSQPSSTPSAPTDGAMHKWQRAYVSGVMPGDLWLRLKKQLSAEQFIVLTPAHDYICVTSDDDTGPQPDGGKDESSWSGSMTPGTYQQAGLTEGIWDKYDLRIVMIIDRAWQREDPFFFWKTLAQAMIEK